MANCPKEFDKTGLKYSRTKKQKKAKHATGPKNAIAGKHNSKNTHQFRLLECRQGGRADASRRSKTIGRLFGSDYLRLDAFMLMCKRWRGGCDCCDGCTVEPCDIDIQTD
jgi:hypothetical protein